MFSDGRRHPGWYNLLIRYPLEVLGAYILIGFFMVLPTGWASDTGGWLGRKLGPRIGASKRARRNLSRVMPELSEAEREQIIIDMWDNLGRSIAEYPHLSRIWDQEDKRIEKIGFEHLDALSDPERPCITVSGHLANWELAQVGAKRMGRELGVIYRRTNNIYINSALLWLRRPASTINFAKGSEGGKRAMAHLKSGGNLGLMIDQKLNEGLPVPFFGIPAMTAPAVASFALKFNCRILPVQTERLDGCRFRITVHPPIDPVATGERDADILAILTELNLIVEGWIRQRPAQWLWTHKRWPDE